MDLTKKYIKVEPSLCPAGVTTAPEHIWIDETIFEYGLGPEPQKICRCLKCGYTIIKEEPEYFYSVK